MTRDKKCYPGGMSVGMKPSDFDAEQLEEGIEEEYEHTCDRRLAQKIAMDHLAEDPDYYRKLSRAMRTNRRASKAEVNEVYQAYYDTVNMTASQLKKWSKDPCSDLASLDRSPIERNLHLLITPKSKWGGREVEWAKRTISFVHRMKAVSPGRSAGSGCLSKRDIALKNWAYNPRSYASNRSAGRMRVVDAEDLAKDMRVTFADRAVEQVHRFDFLWPRVMQNVGDSLAVAYASDKWKPKNANGQRDIELYKHLAESRNRALALPGFLYDADNLEPWPVIGPTISFDNVPMPEHFAILGRFEEVDLFLHTGGTDSDPKFSRKSDDGVIKVQVRHGMLGGSFIRWSIDDPSESDEPFIFVYTEDDGILMIITGEELSIEKDGIVG